MYRNNYIPLFIIYGLYIVVYSNSFIGIVNRNKSGHSVNINIMLRSKSINILNFFFSESRKIILTTHNL